MATSATFGSDTQTIESLRTLPRRYRRSGSAVHVVQGHRDIPALLNATPDAEQDTLKPSAPSRRTRSSRRCATGRLEASPTRSAAARPVHALMAR